MNRLFVYLPLVCGGAMLFAQSDAPQFRIEESGGARRVEILSQGKVAATSPVEEVNYGASSPRKDGAAVPEAGDYWK